MNPHPVDTWHRLVESVDPSGLDELLADDAVFFSPIVHTPQRGKTLAKAYLSLGLRERQWIESTLAGMKFSC